MRISLSDRNITWKEFREKFSKFFPISYQPKKLKVMGEKYKELTGRDPVDEKPKKQKNESTKPKSNHYKASGNDAGSDAKADIEDISAERTNGDQS